MQYRTNSTFFGLRPVDWRTLQSSKNPRRALPQKYAPIKHVKISCSRFLLTMVAMLSFRVDARRENLEKSIAVKLSLCEYNPQ